MNDQLHEIDPDTYWEQDAINDREEWDDHLRAVEDDERELQLRGEAA